MGIYFLTWILIAHIIYMYVAVKTTNNYNIENNNFKKLLIDNYIYCLGWPLYIIGGIILIIAILLAKVLFFISNFLDNINDLYLFFIEYQIDIYQKLKNNKPW